MTPPHPPRSPAARPAARRTSAAATSTLAGILVANAFVRAVVEEAVASGGLEVLPLTAPPASRPVLRVLVAGLDDLGPRAGDDVARLRRAGTAVLVFGRNGQEPALRALAALGAVTATRGAFLASLPELLSGLCARA